jgi:hypothetical protein
MNLVELIKDEVLTDRHINQLASLIGAGEGATKSAVGAAVPALLSALSNLASGGGVQKLLSALGRFDTGAVGEMMSHPSAAVEQGGSLLNSLFGASAIPAIVNALARFSNLAPGSMQKLISYLMPLIMGTIASRFAGKTPTAQGLASLFAEQKANIANAVPSGLSLRDIPGLDAAAGAARTAGRAAQDAGSSAMNWLLPLLGLAALGLLLWFIFGRPAAEPEPGAAAAKAGTAAGERQEVVAPKLPEVEDTAAVSLGKDLSGVLGSLTDTLGGIKDSAAAEAALPKLKEIVEKLTDAKDAVAKLTDAGTVAVRKIVVSAVDKLKGLVKSVLEIQGVGDTIKSVVDAIMSKLTDLSA